jgi:hypothetical protein
MTYNAKNYSAQGGESWVIGGEIHFNGSIYGLTPGTIYYVDPANGSDSNDGLSMDEALASVAAAYALCTDGANDVVAFIGGATADSPTSAITWAKSYTHLIGLTADLPGMGQRCRIVNAAANDLAVLFTLSGSGCIIKNIQFFDGKDKDEDGACVLVSGSRNHFKNVFVAGMGHATPAARAGSYSLKVTGSENYFEDCTIGLDTIVRSAANSELIISGIRNQFRRCTFRSNSVTAGKFLVKVDNSGGDLRDQIFWDCLFFNFTENWANGIDNAFDMPAAGATHFVILKNCTLVGVNSGWADTVTHVYAAEAAPNAGFGVAINPTT